MKRKFCYFLKHFKINDSGKLKERDGGKCQFYTIDAGFLKNKSARMSHC